MGNLRTTLFCLSFFGASAIFSACGEAPAVPESEPTSVSDNRPPTCEQAWVQRISMSPKGRIEEFQRETTFRLNGAITEKTTESHSTRVLEATSDKMTTEVTPRLGRPFSVQLSRGEFLNSCKSAATAPAGVEVLERKRLKVTLQAGSFDCEYVKSRARGTDGSTEVMESWRDAGGTIVKSVSVSQRILGGRNEEVTSILELVRRS